jgi:NADPH:quinone reductase-like Zn-dependent oxidoreductase
VTALCTTKNVDLVRSLGADVVVDYTREVHTTNGEAYDVLFDAVGKSEFEACKGSLAPGGLFITTDLGARWKNPRLVLWTAVFGSHRVLIPIPTYTKNDVLFLKELIEAGRYRAVIDHRYPLEQVDAATSYVESEQKTGNVVLTVIPDTAD